MRVIGEKNTSDFERAVAKRLGGALVAAGGLVDEVAAAVDSCEMLLQMDWAFSRCLVVLVGLNFDLARDALSPLLGVIPDSKQLCSSNPFARSLCQQWFEFSLAKPPLVAALVDRAH